MKIKRILSAFLAGAVVLGSMAIPAYADDTTGTTEETEKTYVAKVGDTQYATLQEAFDAAKTGDTVELLSDVETSETLSIEKSMTLNLKGYTVKAQNGFKEYDELIQVSGDGSEPTNLTVTADKDGGIENAYGPCFMALSVNDKPVNIDINGGTYTSTDGSQIIVQIYTLTVNVSEEGQSWTQRKNYCGLKVSGDTVFNGGIHSDALGNVEITGGTFNLNASGATFIYANVKSNVTVSNANVNFKDAKFLWARDGSTVEVKENVTVKGSSWIPIVAQEEGKIAISGGTYDISGCSNSFDITDYVANGYEAVKNDDGTYAVQVKLIAQVGDTKYSSLQEAVNAAAASTTDKTVTLLCDASGNGVATTDGQTVVIDLNNHKYTIGGVLVGSSSTQTNGFQLKKGSKVTIKNGTLFASDTAISGATTEPAQPVKIVIQNYCDLTLENVNVECEKEALYILSCNYGNTVLNKVNFSSQNPKVTAIDLMHWENDSYIDYAPTLTINNDVNNTINGAIGDVYCNVGDNDVFGKECAPTLKVTGGKFSDKNVAKYISADHTVEETDGLYNVVKRNENFGNVAILTGEMNGNNPLLTLFTGINYLDYKNAGFDVTINGKTESVITNVVYDKVTVGETDYTTAENFGGSKYIFGAKLELDTAKYKDIKEFTIIPFATAPNGEKIYSKDSTTVEIGSSTTPGFDVNGGEEE
mgnify:CR=1 FL=1